MKFFPFVGIVVIDIDRKYSSCSSWRLLSIEAMLGEKKYFSSVDADLYC